MEEVQLTWLGFDAARQVITTILCSCVFKEKKYVFRIEHEIAPKVFLLIPERLVTV